MGEGHGKATFNLIPLLVAVQCRQLSEHKHPVVEEVDDHRDEDSKRQPPGCTSCTMAIGGVASTCKSTAYVTTRRMSGCGCVAFSRKERVRECNKNNLQVEFSNVAYWTYISGTSQETEGLARLRTWRCKGEHLQAARREGRLNSAYC